jgi:hypothetical protein
MVTATLYTIDRKIYTLFMRFYTDFMTILTIIIYDGIVEKKQELEGGYDKDDYQDKKRYGDGV